MPHVGLVALPQEVLHGPRDGGVLKEGGVEVGNGGALLHHATVCDELQAVHGRHDVHPVALLRQSPPEGQGLPRFRQRGGGENLPPGQAQGLPHPQEELVVGGLPWPAAELRGNVVDFVQGDVVLVRLGDDVGAGADPLPQEVLVLHHVAQEDGPRRTLKGLDEGVRGLPQEPSDECALNPRDQPVRTLVVGLDLRRQGLGAHLPPCEVSVHPHDMVRLALGRSTEKVVGHLPVSRPRLVAADEAAHGSPRRA